jgi:FAD/FMN-containing dehydrogenase
VLDGLRGLDKDNSGYDLNQLFIGSEGTLGVVTRARLRLRPRMGVESSALLAMASVPAAVALLGTLRARLGGDLSAFELMLPDAYAGVAGFLSMTPPVAPGAPAYVLCEVQAPDGATAADTFAEALMQAIDDGLASDAVVSQSAREHQALWHLRDSFADYVRSLTHVASGDISVPVPRIAAFLDHSRAALRQIDPDTVFLAFGHLGDGNLHYVVQTPHKDAAMDRLYHLVAEAGGSVSAEHGIGVDKKPWLHLTRSPAEIATMRRLKRALDPGAILNRGRIFDL